jgi:hypothetical protein
MAATASKVDRLPLSESGATTMRVIARTVGPDTGYRLARLWHGDDGGAGG